MQRFTSEPRPDWRKTVESQGFYFHTTDDGQPYWDESAYYQFTSAEIDQLEAATYQLNEMALKAVDHIISRGLWSEFNIPAQYVPWIQHSWDREELTIVGRFDLAYDGSGPPKLLEYNADTPTSLLEAAVVQWHWLNDLHPRMDQFNSIHERLIEAWKVAKQFVGNERIYFAAAEGHLEDYMTVNYLRDTAMQAELTTEYLNMSQIGWNAPRQMFVDPNEQAVRFAFKLYPWEWMMDEQFGPPLLALSTRWLEAPWKVLLSNKALLAVIWELFPHHPNLLPASLAEIPGDVVRKPRQSREGANIQIIRNGQITIETAGDYAGPFVWQQYQPIRTFDGQTPVIGSWMVNGYACGIGIREDQTPITGNLSRFVPHLFE